MTECEARMANMARHDALPSEWRKVSCEYGLRAAVIGFESGMTVEQLVREVDRERYRQA